MIIVDREILDSFKKKTICGWCGKKFRTGLDPAHLFSRGAGQLDIRPNIMSLCRRCHSSSHGGGEPTRIDMLAVVAARENCLQSDIEETVWYLRRLDKRATMEFVIEDTKTLPDKVRAFVLEAMKQAGSR